VLASGGGVSFAPLSFTANGGSDDYIWTATVPPNDLNITTASWPPTTVGVFDDPVAFDETFV